MNIHATPPAPQVMALLCEITGLPDLHDHLDLMLFDEALLDSLATVRLMVALSEEFGIEVSPSDVRREDWATPRLIIAYVESRLQA